MRKCLAEFFGTFALVFAGTGAIVINEVSGGSVTHVGIALTFGLVVLAMIYTFGDVSGPFNPAARESWAPFAFLLFVVVKSMLEGTWSFAWLAVCWAAAWLVVVGWWRPRSFRELIVTRRRSRKRFVSRGSKRSGRPARGSDLRQRHCRSQPAC